MRVAGENGHYVIATTGGWTVLNEKILTSGESAARGDDRGRDAHYCAPPAQNRTGGLPAYGSHLGSHDGETLLDACRMRSSACDTLSRFCARRALCWPAFPSAPALGSTGSAADRSALFARFLATTAGSDFSRPFVIGFGSATSRCGPGRPYGLWSGMRPPRFRRCLFARDGVFDLGGATASRIARPHMLPSTLLNASAPTILWLSRLNSLPHAIVVYASQPPSPTTTPHSLPAPATAYPDRTSTG